jgi:pfkB family carbohydrate kinase
MTGASRYDYLAVGHVTRDVIEDAPGGPVTRPGGGAFYSGLQAARLGLRTLIVTQGLPAEIEELLAPYRDELDLDVIPAPHTTTLATRGAGAGRSQRMLAWAGPMREPIAVSAQIAHFAPVAGEQRIEWLTSAALVGTTPQGNLRQWGEDGEMTLTRLDPGLLPARCDAAVISSAEQPYCDALLAAAQDPAGPLVAVTAGAQPTTLHLPGGAIDSCPSRRAATALDDLGAGDVFAATFFVALTRGHTPMDAAGLGNAAAAVRIGGVGPSAIGSRAQIESVAKAALAG